MADNQPATLNEEETRSLLLLPFRKFLLWVMTQNPSHDLPSIYIPLDNHMKEEMYEFMIGILEGYNVDQKTAQDAMDTSLMDISWAITMVQYLEITDPEALYRIRNAPTFEDVDMIIYFPGDDGDDDVDVDADADATTAPAA